MYEFLVSYGLTWQDLLRLLGAWGAATVLTLFWYWLMSRLGTF